MARAPPRTLPADAMHKQNVLNATGDSSVPARPARDLPIVPQRDDAVSMLRNVPLLAGLTDHQLEQLATRVRRVRVPAGSWVIRQGKAAHSMYIVSTGQL